MAEQQGASSMNFSMKATVYGIKMKFPSVQNISCHQLEQWKKEKNLICLDTRPVEEYRVSHLPDSVRVDPDAEPNLKELGISAGSTVVCYCSVGYRSSCVAQKLLRELKHSEENASSQKPLQIFNLEGGVFQWACEGRGMVNSEGEVVTTIHPYNSFWGKLLPQNLRLKL